MLDCFPIYQVRLARTVDGDRVHDVIAVAAGVRESERGRLFDLLVAALADRGCYGYADCLSLTVSDAIEAAPCSVVAMALRLADRCEPVIRAAMDERRAA